MNILFISIAWPQQGKRNLYSDLMEEFVRQGHKVFVIGTHNSVNTKNSTISIEKEISVVRINSGKIRKATYLRKFMSLYTLGSKYSRAIDQFFRDARFDLIIAPTPPITLSGLYKKLKKHHKASFYLLLKDIWPQGSVDHGVFKKYSFPWLYFRYHEVKIYKLADYIGCMSALSVVYLLRKNKFLPIDKIEVCPNSILPQGIVENLQVKEIRTKYNIPANACVFLFSGNLGIGHGLSFLAEAVQRLSDYKKVFFVLGGSGTHFEYLKNKLANAEVKNTLLYSWLPEEDFDKIRAACDVGLILLHKYTSPQFPSRLLSYLEYSKATLCAVNKWTDIGSIVEKAECGISVSHGNMDDFINAIKYLAEHESIRKEMGKKGRDLLLEKYTVKHNYDIIMKHF